MRSKFFIGSFALAFVFAACTGPSIGTGQENTFNQQENFLYSLENIGESASGWNKLPDFLGKIGMNELAHLELLGGDQKFTEKDCRLIYKKYNETHVDPLSDESCGYNLNADGTYQDYAPNGPIFMTLKQFDEQYLYLHMEEEGLDGNMLLGYSYDLSNGTVRSMNEWPDNFFAMPYYFKGSVCFIESYSIPVAEWNVASGEWKTFDYADGEGDESNDIRIQYTADIEGGQSYDVLDASIVRASTNEILVPSIRTALPELQEAFNATLKIIPNLSTKDRIIFRRVLMSTDAGSYDYYAFDIASKTFRQLSDTEKYGDLYDGFCHTEVD